MVAIIIPIYRNEPTSNDLISIQQCFATLGRFPIIALKPASLRLEHYPFDFSFVRSMDDRHFKSISSYNELMMSPLFYKEFLHYRYILIHQTDAFVFKDNLHEWCLKGYDYIGAPWLRPNVYPDVVKMLKETAMGYVSRFLNLKDPETGLPSVRQLENRVGNGGLSLRRTQIFFDSCLRKKAAINKYLDQSEHMFNEDVFWSIEMNRYRKVLSIPSYKTAAHFAMERSPEIALAYTDGELPFGCHAWDRNMDFYRPIFRAYGYSM